MTDSRFDKIAVGNYRGAGLIADIGDANCRHQPVELAGDTFRIAKSIHLPEQPVSSQKSLLH